MSKITKLILRGAVALHLHSIKRDAAKQGAKVSKARKAVHDNAVAIATLRLRQADIEKQANQAGLAHHNAQANARQTETLLNSVIQ